MLVVAANTDDARELESIRNALGMTIRTFVKRLSSAMGEQIPEARYKNWEYGNTKKAPELVMVAARKLGSGNDVKLERGKIRMIPIAGGIAAGPPTSSDSDIEWEEFPDWGTNFRCWGRPVKGYSIADLLLEGDIVVFEDRRPENGDVVHAFRDGDDCVKSVRNIGTDDVQLYSFNEDYAPFSARGWQYKGVCVGRIRYGAYSIRTVTEFRGGLNWRMRNERF